MSVQPQGASTGRTIQAGVLAWLIPGAGHLLLGHRGLAAVLFVAISFPYWTGLAVGGVKNSVNPWSNKWLFLAEMGIGGYTAFSLTLNRYAGDVPPQIMARSGYLDDLPPTVRAEHVKQLSFYPESDVATIYLAAAGLLNLLAILDALSRAQTGGLPTYYRELEAPASGGATGGGS